jgi:hypothetical protein
VETRDVSDRRREIQAKNRGIRLEKKRRIKFQSSQMQMQIVRLPEKTGRGSSVPHSGGIGGIWVGEIFSVGTRGDDRGRSEETKIRTRRSL